MLFTFPFISGVFDVQYDADSSSNLMLDWIKEFDGCRLVNYYYGVTLIIAEIEKEFGDE